MLGFGNGQFECFERFSKRIENHWLNIFSKIGQRIKMTVNEAFFWFDHFIPYFKNKMVTPVLVNLVQKTNSTIIPLKVELLVFHESHFSIQF